MIWKSTTVLSTARNTPQVLCTHLGKCRFWHDRNEESDPSSSVPALLPNSDVGREGWRLQQTILHARKPMASGCQPASLAAAAAGAVGRTCGYVTEDVTSQQDLYWHQTMLLHRDLQAPGPRTLCLAYSHVLPPRLSMVGAISWRVLLPWGGVMWFCPYRRGAPSPLCLVWNCGVEEVMVHFAAKSVLCCKNIVTLREISSDISEWTYLARLLT